MTTAETPLPIHKYKIVIRDAKGNIVATLTTKHRYRSAAKAVEALNMYYDGTFNFDIEPINDVVKYKVGFVIHQEGHDYVMASSEEEAKEKAKNLLDHYGVKAYDVLFANKV